MQKTDIGLIVLGLVAILVTAIAFAGSSRWANEGTVAFVTSEFALASQGPADAEGAGAPFNWTVPDNATSANLQVAVAFSGQAVQGGSAIVSVRVKMPDGRYAPDTTASMPIPQGSAAPASLALNVSVAWAQVPADVRDVEGSEPAPLVWHQPLDILVVVSQPSDVPLASYSFTASVVGSGVTYRAQ